MLSIYKRVIFMRQLNDCFGQRPIYGYAAHHACAFFHFGGLAKYLLVDRCLILIQPEVVEKLLERQATTQNTPMDCFTARLIVPRVQIASNRHLVCFPAWMCLCLSAWMDCVGGAVS